MEVDQSAIPPRPIVAGAAIIGPTVKGRVNVPTKVTSYAEYKQVFGETFLSGSVMQEFLTSLAARNYFEQGGESLLVTRIANGAAFRSATSTDILPSGSDLDVLPFELQTLSPGKLLNNSPSSSWSSSYENEDGSLVSGSADNIRWQINGINEDRGTFSLIIRRGDDNDKEQIILETFNNLSLDPMNPNFISKVIGDQVETCITDGNEATIQVTQGNYPNRSKYVRVSNVSPIVNYLDTEGNVRIIGGVSASAYLPKAQEGGFTGGTGEPGVCYSGSTSPVEDSAAKAYYFGDLVTTEGAHDYNQGVRTDDYQSALLLMQNVDEYQINILSAPGYFVAENLVAVAEKRTDCIAVVDMFAKNTSVSSVASDASAINSSYAAMYWPWLQMISATGRYEWCPASTVIPGVYAYNDHQAAPWYAPAGMVRGGVQGVIQTARKLTKADRDTLYNKNVNPIATMPGAGIVVYGQKTLQKKASALDRVNVRRLLIEVKDTVKKMASGLLFEQNTTALQNEFKAQVDPYLASVVQRKGLVAYSIDLSENTPDVIDRNEFRCGIKLQPTKTIEFIYLTFTVTATGVSFD